MSNGNILTIPIMIFWAMFSWVIKLAGICYTVIKHHNSDEHRSMVQVSYSCNPANYEFILAAGLTHGENLL